MSCIFSPVPASRCSEQQIVPVRAGEEVLSPALAPLLIAVVLLVCALWMATRRPRRPW